MVFRLFFLLSSVFIHSLLVGQDKVITTRSAREAHIGFRHPALQTDVNSNSIILRLSAAIDMSPRRMKIGVAFTEILEVTLSPMKSPEVSIRFTEVRPFTTPSYRDFPMESVLLPDLVSCNLNLIDLPDSNILRQYRLTGLKVDQLAHGYTSSEIPVFEEGRFSVILTDIDFYFSDDSFGKFQEQISLINDYYAASAIADALLAESESYNPLTTGNLPEKYILLMEINRLVRLMESYRFGEKLSLRQRDPAGFADKFLRLDKFSRSATMTFEDQVASRLPVMWGDDLHPLVDLYISRLVSYIHQSMLLNGIRGGIYREYITTWFQHPGFSHEEMIFHSLIRKMYPADDPVIRLPAVAQAVWDAYLKVSGDLIRESDYVGAIMLLDHAALFREQLPVVLTPDGSSLKAQAVKGIYASYLGIAESCIDLQRFQMAEDYIDHAGEYLAEYRSVIPADTMFKRVFRKLFDRRLQGCDFILGENRYHEALDCYQLFSLSYPPEMIAYVDEHLKSRQQQALKGLFSAEREMAGLMMKKTESDSALVHYDNACRYAEMIVDDPGTASALRELKSRMLPVRYRLLADRGTYLYMTYNHEEAFSTFSQVNEVGELLGIPLDSTLNSMYLDSYKYHMLNEISMATGMIWRDELDLAKDYAKEVESVMDLYNLESDPDLQAALAGYQNKINQKVCLGAKEGVDQLVVRASSNIGMKKFDVAVKQLGDARQRARQHPECMIDLSTVEELIQRYLPAAFYQEKHQQALNQASMGNFREAIGLVSDNERFYCNKQLDVLGVPLISTLDFIAQSGRVPLYQEAISFFLKGGEPYSAYSCLSLIMNAGVDAKDVRELQERVGADLATYDFQLLPDGDQELRIRSYTGGNRWFLKFAQAYARRWDQLGSEQLLKTP